MKVLYWWCEEKIFQEKTLKQISKIFHIEKILKKCLNKTKVKNNTNTTALENIEKLSSMSSYKEEEDDDNNENGKIEIYQNMNYCPVKLDSIESQKFREKFIRNSRIFIGPFGKPYEASYGFGEDNDEPVLHSFNCDVTFM